MQTTWILPCILAFLATNAAAATALESDFSNAGATTFHGPHELDWHLAAGTLHSGNGSIDLQDATVHLINTPVELWVLYRPDTHPTTVSSPLQPERLRTWSSVDRFVFEVDGGAFRVLPAQGTLTASSTGPDLDFAHPGTTALEPDGSPYRGVTQLEGRSTIPSRDTPFTDVTLADGTMGLHLRGGHAILSGGTGRMDGEAVDLPRMRLDEAASAYDPVTGTGRYVYDNHHLLVVARDGRTVGVGDWHLAARSMQGSLDGLATWFGVEGGIGAGNDLADDPSILEVQGDMEFSASLDSTTARWHLEGQSVSVRADLLSIGGGVPAAVGGIGIVALLASLVTAGGRGLATFLLGRWTPAGVQATPLESRARRRILAVVHEHQPVRMGELQQRTGLSRGTLRYHLRILEATRVLQHDDSGGPRQKAFMLNSGSLRFAIADGTTAAGALSAATHPVRRHLYEALLAGDADQDALLAALRDAGRPVARSTLSHHLSKMVDAGLLSATRRDGRKLYAALLHPETARAEQYRRYLGGEGLLAPVEHVLGGASHREALLSRLVSDGATPRRARTMVERLEALAILEPHDGRLRVAPSVRAALTHRRDT